MSAQALIVFAMFAVLAACTWISKFHRARFLSRDKKEWLVDGLSLVMQGVFVPALRLWLMLLILPWIWPGGAGLIHFNFISSFLLCFIGVDYLYYWNHRWLHTRAMWRWHRVHHTAKTLDFAVTSRNSLVTHFLLVYLWVLGLVGYLLSDASGFWWGMAATAALDLWRHSSLPTPRWVQATFGRIFILPNDHEWHHSRDLFGVNFGANLNVWDRLHGTFYRGESACPHLGVHLPSNAKAWLLASRVAGDET